MGLDDALEYITDDEQVEVTPQSIRIRKVRIDRDRDSLQAWSCCGIPGACVVNRKTGRG
jgi:hypothetical protein